MIGLTAHFYQSCWEIVEEDIYKVDVSFFRGDYIPNEIHETIIFLVPKVVEPSRFKDFIAIKFCNMIYKIFSKIITTRLSSFIQEIISLVQGVFIKGRLIIEKIAIGQELVHKIDRKAYSSNNVLKLDMEKAFDRR